MPKDPKWTKESLRKAMEEVEQGAGKRATAEKYNIPWGTFSDKLSGRRKIESTAQTYLTPEEEKDIVKYLMDMGQRGFGRTKEELFLTVKHMLDFNKCQTKWPDNMPSDKWFRLFSIRHPEICFRKPQRLGNQRAIITPNEITRWFESFADTIKSIDPTILLEPERLYNYDESGFSLDALTGCVLSFVGTKFVYQVGSDNKTMITVLVCASAVGHYTWPMLIYPGTQFRGFQPNDVFKDSFITKSKNGWINQDIFAEWLECVFLPQTSHVKRPLVLLVDGHVSHKSLQASKTCQDNGVILYALPAHSSHIMQPLDVGVFKTMKCEWKKAVKKQNEAEIITKKAFAIAFKDAYENTICKQLAAQAFRKSGLYPFDKNNIDWSKITASPITTPSGDCHLLPVTTVDKPGDANMSISAMSSSCTSTSIEVPTQSTHVSLTHAISAPIESQPASASQMAVDELSTSIGGNAECTLVSTVRKFAMICAQIGEPQLNRYFTRLEEGFDCEDSLYSTWKKYHADIICASGSQPQQSTSVSTPYRSEIEISKNPLTIPYLVRGTRKKKTEKVPALLSGHDFREQLIRKDEAQKEAERKKAQRKKEMEERKKRRAEIDEEKKRQRAERKKQQEERKKQKEEEMIKRKEERKRKLEEKQSKQKNKRPAKSKSNTGNLTSGNDTSVDEREMILDDDSDLSLSDVMVNDSFDFQSKIVTAMVSGEVDMSVEKEHSVTDEHNPINIPEPKRSLWELFQADVENMPSSSSDNTISRSTTSTRIY